jgi:DNA-binding transcriptional regulator YhcF (GntR family)
MNRSAQTDPPYLQIVAELLRRIDAGELRPGDRVPSTRQIAEEWGVATATATKALLSLSQQGAVRAVPRVGTVVAAPERKPASPPHASRRRAAREPAEEPTRERVVRAAIEIADAEGLAALSMRSVAARLDVATMSLYRYVPSKDDLVQLMTDTVFGDDRLPETPPHGWRARLELAARLQWAIYRRHPWLSQLVPLNRPLPLPNLMIHGEWALAALDGLGLSAVTMLHIHITLYSYVRGIAINLESEAQAEAETGLTGEQWMDSQESAFEAIAASEGFPTFARVVNDLAKSGYDFDLDTIFEFGLGPMLDGLAALIEGPRR